ncbi:hypothetical protein [Ferribacterium limneticum]|uniref:hypothetical protein n=1 Tax=Ferribacterium limneticum TaxID=76259 RepID=UPI001CF94C4A|nr:hypothetical protein [Ferribacterium limneticum]UCV28269.1 hypothetical protein KI617_18825 [Ferribacterium limneticum]UCV32186.1 hypothetical protein KI608_18825 [Ferribacterium limneticum]
MADLKPGGRLPLLFFGMLSLLGGVMAGLARLGWEVPAPAVQAAGVHGPLMIAAFFGTVISLERAVAAGRNWAYLAPLAAGASGIALLAGAPLLLGQILGSLAAFGLIAASAVALRRQVAVFTIILTLAAGCWLVGNLLWLVTGEVSAAVAWWLLFLVLTIAGERLELTRFLPTPPLAQKLFIGIVGQLLVSAVASLYPLFSVGLIALAVWLLRYDIARRNIATEGLTRFIAACLLSGYAWLLAAGLLGLAGAFVPGHPWRDAALHAIGLGFVFAMVFGHAPIIFPAVTRIKIPYHPALYLPLTLLHLTLALRVFGSLADNFDLRHNAALLNGLVLVVFIATLVTLVRRNAKRGAR